MSGTLYICATPIGNLEDVSRRLVRVLSEVDLVAAEDTRRTRKLLSAIGVSARLVSYHDANERKQTPFLIRTLESGRDVALVSDGGMPAISDPGYGLVRAAIDKGFDITVIPGPTSVTTALVLSGLPTARFAFEGFLPRGASEQRNRLSELAREQRTLVFFEAPTRVKGTLVAMLEVFGDRRVSVAREMTKIHEEVLRGPLSEVIAQLEDRDILGEIVIVIEGAPEIGNLEDAVENARALVTAGSTPSQAAARSAKEFHVHRRDVYGSLVGDQVAKGSQSG